MLRNPPAGKRAPLLVLAGGPSAGAPAARLAASRLAAVGKQSPAHRQLASPRAAPRDDPRRHRLRPVRRGRDGRGRRKSAGPLRRAARRGRRRLHDLQVRLLRLLHSAGKRRSLSLRTRLLEHSGVEREEASLGSRRARGSLDVPERLEARARQRSPSGSRCFSRFSPADYLYVPGLGGTVHKVDKTTGASLGRINPFPDIDPARYVAGGLGADASGRVVYNVLALDPLDPLADVRGAWLVRVETNGTAASGRLRDARFLARRGPGTCAREASPPTFCPGRRPRRRPRRCFPAGRRGPV